MWLLSSVVVVAFMGNLAAEILAEGVATVGGQIYQDWFWALDARSAIADADQRYREVDAMIAAAEERMFHARGAPTTR